MRCISKKFSVDGSLTSCLVLVFLLNNLQCSTSALSTTVPSVLSSNFSSHEPSCSNVKDLFSQRGIADKDLPAKFPIKGENRFKFDMETRVRCYKRENEQWSENITLWGSNSPFPSTIFRNFPIFPKALHQILIQKKNVLRSETSWNIRKYKMLKSIWQKKKN